VCFAILCIETLEPTPPLDVQPHLLSFTLLSNRQQQLIVSQPHFDELLLQPLDVVRFHLTERHVAGGGRAVVHIAIAQPEPKQLEEGEELLVVGEAELLHDGVTQSG